jgi:hypothetical protein
MPLASKRKKTELELIHDARNLHRRLGKELDQIELHLKKETHPAKRKPGRVDSFEAGYRTSTTGATGRRAGAIIASMSNAEELSHALNESCFDLMHTRQDALNGRVVLRTSAGLRLGERS